MRPQPVTNTMYIFDTHQCVLALKKGGFTEKQAESITSAINNSSTDLSELVTKEDLNKEINHVKDAIQILREQIQFLDKKFEARFEAFEAKFQALEMKVGAMQIELKSMMREEMSKQTKWLVSTLIGMTFAIIGGVVALLFKGGML